MDANRQQVRQGTHTFEYKPGVICINTQMAMVLKTVY